MISDLKKHEANHTKEQLGKGFVNDEQSSVIALNVEVKLALSCWASRPQCPGYLLLMETPSGRRVVEAPPTRGTPIPISIPKVMLKKRVALASVE